MKNFLMENPTRKMRIYFSMELSIYLIDKTRITTNLEYNAESNAFPVEIEMWRIPTPSSLKNPTTRMLLGTSMQKMYRVTSLELSTSS